MAWIAALIVASMVAAFGSLVMLLSKVGVIVRWVTSRGCTCELGVANSMGIVKSGPYATGGGLAATEVSTPGKAAATGFGSARTPTRTARSTAPPQALLDRSGRFDRGRTFQLAAPVIILFVVASWTILIGHLRMN